MTHNGYVCFPRGWMNMPALTRGHDPFCKMAAWAWLVEKANWADENVDIVGQTVLLKRGQLSTPLRELASRWNWSVGAVRRFLERLSKDEQIATHSDIGQQIITICKYEEYTAHNRNMSTRPAHDRHTTGTYIIKEEDKKESKSTPYPLSDDEPLLFDEPEPKVVDSAPKQSAGQVIQMPSVPADRVAVMAAWNAMAEVAGLPKAKALTPDRSRQIAARLKEHGTDGVLQAITAIGKSDFCRGKNPSGWVACFDFLLQPKSCAKAIEGSYDNRGRPNEAISPLTGQPIRYVNGRL